MLCRSGCCFWLLLISGGIRLLLLLLLLVISARCCCRCCRSLLSLARAFSMLRCTAMATADLAFCSDDAAVCSSSSAASSSASFRLLADRISLSACALDSRRMGREAEESEPGSSAASASCSEAAASDSQRAFCRYGCSCHDLRQVEGGGAKAAVLRLLPAAGMAVLDAAARANAAATAGLTVSVATGSSLPSTDDARCTLAVPDCAAMLGPTRSNWCSSWAMCSPRACGCLRVLCGSCACSAWVWTDCRYERRNAA